MEFDFGLYALDELIGRRLFFLCLCAELRSDAGSISDVWFASSFPIYLCLFVENHVRRIETAWRLLLFQPALLNSSFTFSAAPTMDPLFPFSPYAHGLSIPPLWHHGGHFHTPPPMYEDDNDSGYASSERDFPHHHGMEVDESFEDLDPTDDPMSWQLRGTGSRNAFEIRRRRLDIFEPCSELHDAFCACDTALNHYVSGPHLKVNTMQRCPHQEHWQPRPYPDLFEPVRPSRRKKNPTGETHQMKESHHQPAPATAPASTWTQRTTNRASQLLCRLSATASKVRPMALLRLLRIASRHVHRSVKDGRGIRAGIK